MATETEDKVSLPPQGGGSDIDIDGKYVLRTSIPLPEFSHTYAKAFAARSAKSNIDNLLGKVIAANMPVRESVIQSLIETDDKHILNLFAEYKIDWAEDGTRRRLLLFERPPGLPLVPDLNATFEPMREDDLTQYVIKPVCQALKLLNDKGIFHGDVRPTNMYRIGNELSSVVLGECVSAITSSRMPVMFETIERGMAAFNSRGRGTVREDLYALGVTICILGRGENFLKDYTDEEILDLKIEKGSYALMSEGIRASPTLSELLRGVLTDDSSQRWGIDEIDSWINGRRQTPKQKSTTASASRGFDFNDKKFLRPRKLAMELHKNPSQVIEVIENGSLEQWVVRALNDSAMAMNLKEAVEEASASGRSVNYGDRLASYVSMVLDPSAPIRYRGLTLTPYGFGATLYMALLNQENTDVIIELLKSKILVYWQIHPANLRAETADMVRSFDTAKKYMERKLLGEGIERCLYELYEDAPCLAEGFLTDCVTEPSEILPSLERAAKANKRPKQVIDRHLAAFLTARDRKDYAGVMMGLSKLDPVWRNLCLLNLLAGLGRRFNSQDQYPVLCRWLEPQFRLILQRFKNQRLRDKLDSDLASLIQNGDVQGIYKLLDNPTIVSQDRHDYNIAMRQFQLLSNKLRSLERTLEKGVEAYISSGRELAAMSSCLIAVVIIIITLLLNVGS